MIQQAPCTADGRAELEDGGLLKLQLNTQDDFQ